MNAYIYQAELYCEECGESIRADLTAEGKAPSDPEDEYSYDSDEFPKGPCKDGGGESDCPEHCANCHVFLENPLTSEGYEYTRENFSNNAEVMAFYALDPEDEEETED